MEEKKQNLQHPHIYEEDEIDLYELWLILKIRKKVILITMFIFVSLGVAFAFLKTPIYKSEAKILPISSSASPLSELTGLAAMAGISIGDSGGDSAKIKAILNSNEIKKRVVKKLNLIELLFDKIPENRNPILYTIEFLDKMTKISDDKKTGVITISVDYKNPEIAQKIVSAYIDELQKIMNEKSLTVAKFNRISLEKQLKEQEEKLKKLESKLAEFQKKTKIISPENQLSGVMELYSSLVQQKIKLSVEIKTLESAFSKENPKVKALKEQLKAIENQLKSIEDKTNIGALPSLSKAPEKLVEYANIMRELKIAQAVYETLVKMYEQAKFQEAKENIYVEIIDEPSLPDRPYKPKKKLIVAVAGVSGLFLGIFLAFFIEWIENMRKRHQEQESAT